MELDCRRLTLHNYRCENLKSYTDKIQLSILFCDHIYIYNPKNVKFHIGLITWQFFVAFHYDIKHTYNFKNPHILPT
jgi:hypothetical protein